MLIRFRIVGNRELIAEPSFMADESSRCVSALGSRSTNVSANGVRGDQSSSGAPQHHISSNQTSEQSSEGGLADGLLLGVTYGVGISGVAACNSGTKPNRGPTCMRQ